MQWRKFLIGAGVGVIVLGLFHGPLNAAVSRLKTWATGETLTATDLNAEFNNILNNGEDLAWPATKAKDYNGNSLQLDPDADTTIDAATDDRIDFALSGTDLFRFDGTATTPVNGLDFVASAAGTDVAINAVGSDTDINIDLVPKGAGNVLVSGSAVGDVTDVFGCSSGDCASITIAATDLLDLSGSDASTATEGLILPQHATACAGGTAEGQVCWEADDDILYIGDSSALDAVAMVGVANTFTADQTIQDTGSRAVLDISRPEVHGDAADVAAIRGRGQDSGSATTTYAETTYQAVLDDAGGENGEWAVRTIQSATEADRLVVRAGVYTAGATGGDQGADTINASELYDDGDRVETCQLDTEQATTSGSSKTFSSPYTTTTTIEVFFDGVSLNGTTDEVGVQLGDSGGLEVTGYDSASGWPGVDANEFLTTAFQISNDLAVGEGIIGRASIMLADSANNTWIETGNVWPGGAVNSFNISSGVKSLDGTLTQLAVLVTGTPTDAFDAGAVNVRWCGY